MKMNPVVHFEMPYENPKRMADFYTATFGWETKMMGEDWGNYVLAMTTETEGMGRPKTPGAINGGFYPKKQDWSAQYPSVVIAVDDIGESMKKVTKAGGKVLGEPVEIPGVGRYVSFFDTEGNRVSMLQPSPGMWRAHGIDQKFQYRGQKPSCCGPGVVGWFEGLKKSRANKLTAEQRKEIAQKAAKKRWEKKG